MSFYLNIPRFEEFDITNPLNRNRKVSPGDIFKIKASKLEKGKGGELNDVIFEVDEAAYNGSTRFRCESLCVFAKYCSSFGSKVSVPDCINVDDITEGVAVYFKKLDI